MKNLFSKESLINMVLWIVFGFVSYSAGARWSVNPVAFIGMYAIVLTMVLREFSSGLTQGSEIANTVWKAKMDELFEKLRNG